VIAAEFARRRLTFQAEGWLGPRPGSTRWFDAIQQWARVPAEAATDLIGALAETESNRAR
jgi:hypothetical protein